MRFRRYFYNYQTRVVGIGLIENLKLYYNLCDAALKYTIRVRLSSPKK